VTDVREAVRAGLARRGPLLAQMRDEQTECVRLFHGIAEGVPGLTVDRYGPVLLVQTRAMQPSAGQPSAGQPSAGQPSAGQPSAGQPSAMQPSATADEIEAIAELTRRALGVDLALAWNVRGAPREAQPPFASALAPSAFVGLELGSRFDVHPRHRGQDPLLFLDFRVARRRVRALAAGRSVLNLFAYTCGIGVAAARGGASEVWNVDFAASALEVGRRNAELNDVDPQRFRTIEADVLPTVRQLAGLPVKGRGARRGFERFAPRRFDLVVLDPPRWAKTPFGAVDVVNDYPSLLKPAIGCTRSGGLVLATHHVPGTSREAFAAIVRRTAEKMGRGVRALEVLGPEEDFPSFDGEPPLKIALAEIA
jgi:23S rRNA (cytosine1962-C5)-methyltransferase